MAPADSPTWRAVRAFARNRVAVVGLAVLAALVLFAALGPVLSPYDPTAASLGGSLEAPSLRHPLGTDELGRDLMTRLAMGARLSLLLSALATLSAAGVGVPLGLVGGYYGGRADLVTQRLVDALLVMPSIVLAIVLASVFGAGITGVVAAVAITTIPAYARLARAMALTLGRRDFVMAARALGATDLRILLRYVLPNALGPLTVQASLGTGAALLTASALGFLGLGVQPPDPEWGAMLSRGRAYLTAAPAIVAYPGGAIVLSVLAFNLVGDGLRDSLDPRQRAAR